MDRPAVAPGRPACHPVDRRTDDRVRHPLRLDVRRGRRGDAPLPGRGVRRPAWRTAHRPGARPVGGQWCLSSV
ncbi:hypothetical protein ACFFX0_14080 [Citricoccus parietis]|uniref:Uncharacterized protein n=1 Tax=Citricoccus parietis TaxID=592307 RepID=A0ABV5G180_9MICC